MTVPKLESTHSGKPIGEAPALILGSALGSTHAIWDGALVALEDSFAVVRFDLPGHGLTPSASAGFTVEELADAVVEVADRRGIDRFYIAGVSIGGAISLVLARKYPTRVLGAGIVCSAPTFGGATSGFLERAASVRASGMSVVAPNIPQRWFAETFRESNPHTVTAIVAMVGQAQPEGYAQCCEALATYDETKQMSKIACPVVVISGEEDPGCPPSAGARIVEAVSTARQVVIEHTSHLAVVEDPRAVAQALIDTFH